MDKTKNAGENHDFTPSHGGRGLEPVRFADPKVYRLARLKENHGIAERRGTARPFLGEHVLFKKPPMQRLENAPLCRNNLDFMAGEP